MLKKPPLPRASDSRQDPQYRQRWDEYWRQSNNPDRPNRFWTPSLLIPYDYDDTGARAILKGTKFWMSPFIWVDSSDPLGNPVAGQPNFVHVAIWNYGMPDAAWVYVDFYWADPSMGLGPADMNPIGHERVIVHRGEIKEVTCRTPWVPDMRDQGHQCLMVNCHSHVLAPIHFPFQPTLDPQVGQHNMTVIEATPGQKMSFGINLNNPFGARIDTAAAVWCVQTLLRDRASRRTILKQLSETVEQLLPARTGFRLQTELGESSVAPGTAKAGSRLVAERLLREAEAAAAPPRIERETLHEVSLQPLERRHMEITIEVPRHTRHGELTVFHFEQLVRDTTIGGYSIAVIVP